MLTGLVNDCLEQENADYEKHRFQNSSASFPFMSYCLETISTLSRDAGNKNLITNVNTFTTIGVLHLSDDKLIGKLIFIPCFLWCLATALLMSKLENLH